MAVQNHGTQTDWWLCINYSNLILPIPCPSTLYRAHVRCRWRYSCFRDSGTVDSSTPYRFFILSALSSFSSPSSCRRASRKSLYPKTAFRIMPRNCGTPVCGEERGGVGVRERGRGKQSMRSGSSCCLCWYLCCPVDQPCWDHPLWVIVVIHEC